MKVIMSERGDLIVSPESSVENYALLKWIDEHECGEGPAIIIAESWNKCSPRHHLRVQEVKII